MVELTESVLKQIHNIELEMLIEVDRICRKNNINYTIIGGTLLGAVRNGGFIPWDDDADVAMLRPEYEKFTNVLKKDLDISRFHFQDMRVTDGYRWGYGKIRRRNTLFLRENQELMSYEQGIFLDVFPQDAVPDSVFFRRVQDIRCFLVRKFFWSEVGRKCEKNPIKRFIYKVMSHAPRSRIICSYDRLIFDDNTSKLVRTLTFPAPKHKYGYKRKWLTETSDIIFEGCMLRGVKDYDGWLKWEFGDYMKIPPQNKRKCHPISELKLL